MNTTTKIQVKITYVNGLGETKTTEGSFDSMDHLAEVLKASGQRILSFEITSK
jgi:hypothetical protein